MRRGVRASAMSTCRLLPVRLRGYGARSNVSTVPIAATTVARAVTPQASRIAVLSRDTMMRVMDEEPRLGGRIMLRLVHLLSERLRRTSARLVTEAGAAREA